MAGASPKFVLVQEKFFVGFFSEIILGRKSPIVREFGD